MAGKFLLGDSEAVGHGGYLADRPALLFTIFNSNEAKVNILRSHSCSKFFCPNLWAGKRGGSNVLSESLVL